MIKKPYSDDNFKRFKQLILIPMFKKEFVSLDTFMDVIFKYKKGKEMFVYYVRSNVRRNLSDAEILQNKNIYMCNFMGEVIRSCRNLNRKCSLQHKYWSLVIHWRRMNKKGINMLSKGFFNISVKWDTFKQFVEQLSQQHKETILEKSIKGNQGTIYYLDNYCIFRGEYLKNLKSHVVKNSINTGVAVKFVDDKLSLLQGINGFDENVFLDSEEFEEILEDLEYLFMNPLKNFLVEDYKVSSTYIICAGI